MCLCLPSVGVDWPGWRWVCPLVIFYLVCRGLTVVFFLHVHAFFLKVSVIADLLNMFGFFFFWKIKVFACFLPFRTQLLNCVLLGSVQCFPYKSELLEMITNFSWYWTSFSPNDEVKVVEHFKDPFGKHWNWQTEILESKFQYKVK